MIYEKDFINSFESLFEQEAPCLTETPSNLKSIIYNNQSSQLVNPNLLSPQLFLDFQTLKNLFLLLQIETENSEKFLKEVWQKYSIVQRLNKPIFGKNYFNIIYRYS